MLGETTVETKSKKRVCYILNQIFPREQVDRAAFTYVLKEMPPCFFVIPENIPDNSRSVYDTFYFIEQSITQLYFACMKKYII